MTSLPCLVAIGGLLLMAILMSRRVRGALLLGILVTAAAGMVLGLARLPAGVVALPHWGGPQGLAAIAGKLRFSERLADGRTISLFSMTLLPVLLTLFLMDFLDTLGTLMGVGAVGNMLDEKGNFPRIERPMMVDAERASYPPWPAPRHRAPTSSRPPESGMARARAWPQSSPGFSSCSASSWCRWPGRSRGCSSPTVRP